MAFRRRTGYLLQFVLLLSLAVLCSCRQSNLYSPLLDLPNDPLRKNEGEVGVSLLMLPHTRPQSYDESTRFGNEATIGYGFSDRLMLRGRAWGDWRYFGGFGIDGLWLMTSDTTGWRPALVPRIAAVTSIDEWNELGLDGFGVAAMIAVWSPDLGIAHFYGGLGPALGCNDIYDLFRESDAWGYGMIATVGAGVDLPWSLSLGLELSAALQVNAYDNRTDLVPAPALSLGWRF